MRYIVATLLLLGCIEHKNQEMTCKIVKEVGGCGKWACAVRFTDNTFTERAEYPLTGMEMCTLSDWHGTYIEGAKVREIFKRISGK